MVNSAKAGKVPGGGLAEINPNVRISAQKPKQSVKKGVKHTLHGLRLPFIGLSPEEGR